MSDHKEVTVKVVKVGTGYVVMDQAQYRTDNIILGVAETSASLGKMIDAAIEATAAKSEASLNK